LMSFFFIFFSVSFYAQNPEKPGGADKFAGIGISVDIDSAANLPYIVEVLSGKPGAMAGLRSGDKIIEINKWKTYKKSREKVAQKLRGKAGSTVAITLQRNGAEMKFDIKRQVIVIENEPANLCDGLDRVIRAGGDTFKMLKGAVMNEPTAANRTPFYRWASVVKLPKFQESTIVKHFSDPAYFQAMYYLGKDSIQAINRFDKLVSDVRSCLPYTIADSYQETATSDITGFKTNFVISQVKQGNAKNIKGATIYINYLRLKDGLYEVWFDYKLHL
jgi:membrane-associated protease RseP (regulator of RpoE activity)